VIERARQSLDVSFLSLLTLSGQSVHGLLSLVLRCRSSKRRMSVPGKKPANGHIQAEFQQGAPSQPLNRAQPDPETCHSFADSERHPE
jgi:hypothetical protein